MNLNRLEGTVAWISGGSSGIGEATAKLFAQEGACVAVVNKDLQPCLSVVEQIKEVGGQAISIECNVADEKQVQESIAESIKAFGRIDILVNNAGIVDVRKLHEYDALQFEHVIAVNLKSMFYSFKHAYPHLRKQTHSYVVNVGSISSFVGQAVTPVYTTTKHAVLGLTRSIALDYAIDGIRCNCVCPGITDTPMLREHLGDENSLMQRLRRVPMHKSLTPHDVARSILYLSCEDSAGITGTSLIIDGGYLSAAEWDVPDGHVD